MSIPISTPICAQDQKSITSFDPGYLSSLHEADVNPHSRAYMWDVLGQVQPLLSTHVEVKINWHATLRFPGQCTSYRRAKSLLYGTVLVVCFENK